MGAGELLDAPDIHRRVGAVLGNDGANVGLVHAELAAAGEAQQQGKGPAILAGQGQQQVELAPRFHRIAVHRSAGIQQTANEVLVLGHTGQDDLGRIDTDVLADAQLPGGAHLEAMHIGADKGNGQGIRLHGKAERRAGGQSFLQQRHPIAQGRLVEDIQRRAEGIGGRYEVLVVHRSPSLRAFEGPGLRRARRARAAARLCSKRAARSTFPFLVRGIDSTATI